MTFPVPDFFVESLRGLFPWFLAIAISPLLLRVVSRGAMPNTRKARFVANAWEWLDHKNEHASRLGARLTLDTLMANAAELTPILWSGEKMSISSSVF